MSYGIFFPSKRCDGATLLDVSGTSMTGADGKRVFRLTEYVCLDRRLLQAPVNLLATPSSTAPVFVTTSYAIVDPNDLLKSDVEITVFGWDATGNPAPNLAFHWRCRVQSGRFIL